MIENMALKVALLVSGKKVGVGTMARIPIEVGVCVMLTVRVGMGVEGVDGTVRVGMGVGGIYVE
jgi:hypothetical protein